LHTCYAPVRHSHILLLKYLPFDLHVLGLPLAFILSQDQTLHCNYSYNSLLQKLSHLPQVPKNSRTNYNKCSTFRSINYYHSLPRILLRFPPYRSSSQGPLSSFIHSKNVFIRRSESTGDHFNQHRKNPKTVCFSTIFPSSPKRGCKGILLGISAQVWIKNIYATVSCLYTVCVRSGPVETNVIGTLSWSSRNFM
jgi:hypothetical protein